MIRMVISIFITSLSIVNTTYADQDKNLFDSPHRVTAETFAKIFDATGETIFCGCTYSDWELVKDEINPCYYYMPDKKDKQISWHRVVDVREFAKKRQCWKSGGLKNCIRNDEAVRYYMSDPLIYLPAEPQLERLVERYRGYKSGFPGEDDFGLYCNTKVDTRSNQIIPRVGSRGDLARVMLYVRERYKLEMDIPVNELNEWDKKDRVSVEECRRSANARSFIGYGNPHVDKGCQGKL